MIRNVDQQRLVNMDVKCVPGAKMTDLDQHAKSLSKNYDRVVIVGGGNYCDDPDTSGDVIVKKCGQLV